MTPEEIADRLQRVIDLRDETNSLKMEAGFRFRRGEEMKGMKGGKKMSMPSGMDCGKARVAECDKHKGFKKAGSGAKKIK